MITGAPTLVDIGEHPVEVDIRDVAGLVISQSFTITVELPWVPIAATALSLTTLEDSPIDSQVRADHVTGDVLTFEVSAPPVSGVVTVTDVTTGTFTYLPQTDFAGEDVFSMTISDTTGFAVTMPVSITVEPVNDLPQIDVTDAVTATAGDEINLPVAVTDPDSTVVTVAAENLPPGLALVEDNVISGVVAADAITDTTLAETQYVAVNHGNGRPRRRGDRFHHVDDYSNDRQRSSAGGTDPDRNRGSELHANRSADQRG